MTAVGRWLIFEVEGIAIVLATNLQLRYLVIISFSRFFFKYATATTVAHSFPSAPSSLAFSNIPDPTTRANSAVGENDHQVREVGNFIRFLGDSRRDCRSRSWRTGNLRRVGWIAGWASASRISSGEGERTIGSSGLGEREGVQQAEHDPSSELIVETVSVL
ncbi:hypothetical protein EV401DRAFT_205858 [Pisolithus croceorrhizus]|nr:hypothetical protein EV401DRAFT_205858 [Pisolithus croceorrhizus]